MLKISKHHLAIAGLLAGINILGLVWIHNDLTTISPATVRLISFNMLPNEDSASRLSLSFDRNMIPAENVGQVEKASIFKLTPEWPGEWVWSAPDKLEYVLAEQLPLGRIFKISATEELKKITGKTIEGKDEVEFKTSALAVVKSEIIACDQSDVTFRIIFNQPVDPGELLRHISFYDTNNGNKIKLGEPVCLTQLPAETLILRFSCPASGSFEMDLNEELKGYNAQLPLGWWVVSNYYIPKGFSVLNVQAEMPNLDEIASVRLNFSNKLNTEQTLPELTIEPAVDKTTISRSYSGLTITGKFKAGSRYTIKVPGTILSDDNKTLGEDKSISVFIPEYHSRFQFNYNDGILSPYGNLELDAKAVNVEGLNLQAWRVHANNLVSHLQRSYDTQATSRQILTKKVDLNLPANKPQNLTLDLKGLLPPQTGIYRISAEATNTRWIEDNALVTITDLAITAKSQRNGSLVWVTSLRTGEPVSNVKVKAITYNNQTLTSAITDSNGLARLKFANNGPDGDVWVITAEKDDDLSYLQPEDNQWVLDDVPNTGRPYARNYEVMLYTERGVYRPGETMHLTGIIRDRAGAIPPSFTMAVKITRPDGRQVAELIAKPLAKNQGVFNVDFPTRADCQTGLYNVRVTLPGSNEILGSTQTNVECFIPVRMEVSAEPAATRFGPNEPIAVKVRSRYLWDEPAAEIPAVITGTLKSIEYQSNQYPQYKFGCKTNNEVIVLPDSQSELDANGFAQIQVQLPPALKAGLYRMLLSATVTETGGRSVSANTSATLDTVDKYIGIKLSSGNVVPVGNPVDVNWVRLTGEDKPAPEGQLKMRLVRVEYDTVIKLVDNRRVWESTERIRQIGEERIITPAATQGNFEVICPESGNFRIILTDVQSDASSTLDFYASQYTAGPQSVPMNQPEHLEILTDKDKYSAGETAKVVIQSPIPGRFLLTVENDSVVSEYFGTIANNSAQVNIPISQELRGSAFLTATIIRAVDPNQKNWLPHRAMGTTRILMDHTNNAIPITITGPKSAEPGKTITITVDTEKPLDPNNPAVVQLWAVDEGVLLTTNYLTPNPHKFFLGPRRLSVSTSDIFLNLLPDHKRPTEITKIGAGDFEINSLRRNPVPAKYRQSAVIWQEALPVDANGQLTSQFKLPDLIGQMRFMAVVVNKDSYNQAEHDMVLTSPLIAEASWPRFVAPGDEFEVPVKLFNSTDRPLNIQLKTSLTGPVEVVTDYNQDKLQLNPDQPVTIMLKLKAIKSGSVEANIEVSQTDPNNKSLTAINQATFSVRPATPLHSIIELHSIKAGEQLSVVPSSSFIDGTTSVTVSVSSRPNVQLGPALEQLIHYPYGCVEQTSSQLFSLLYASSVLGDERKEMIDSMVKAGIARLWSMQTRSGGLSYWPGYSTPDLWGTAYATSCLLEAKNAGYEIDALFTNELVKYLEQCLKTTGDGTPDLNTKALICRALAAFGEPQRGWMARLAEQKDQLNLAAVAHLAEAFYTTGNKNDALTLLPKQMPTYFGITTTSGYLTSPAQQQAVLLSALLDIEPEHPMATLLARKLNETKTNCHWGSTFNNAAVIAALSRYQVMTGKDEPNFSGTMTFAGQQIAAFDHNKPVLHKFENLSGPVTITSTGIGTVYAVVVSEGLAREGIVKPYDSGLHIERKWTDRHGKPVEPNNLRVGDIVNVTITVIAPSQVVDNIAVVDALPGGMEIENPRLATSARSSDSQFETPNHVEFLDDRVVLFCSAGPTKKVFAYALRATTTGKFTLPPIQASCMYEPAIASLGAEGQVTINNNKQPN
jgi:alpha-2-macroglobulin